VAPIGALTILNWAASTPLRTTDHGDENQLRFRNRTVSRTTLSGHTPVNFTSVLFWVRSAGAVLKIPSPTTQPLLSSIKKMSSVPAPSNPHVLGCHVCPAFDV
jgi:hypothetical protein